MADTRNGLPNYSLLEEVPSRGLPDYLTEAEADPRFIEYRARIEKNLRSQLLSDIEAARFVELADSRGSPLTIQTNHGRSLLVFSEPLKAADYARVQVPALELVFVSSTTRDLLKLLKGLEGSGVRDFTIDRCPRCDVFTSFGMESARTADDVAVALSIFKASEIARSKLYSDFAIMEALDGRFLAARDISLEAVGHVTPTATDHHILLGQCGVMLNDWVLFGEAVSYLDFLGHPDWVSLLHSVRETGEPRLPRPRPSP